jgi:predicted dehydrogenase
VDPRIDRLDQASTEIPLKHRFNHLESALSAFSDTFAGVVVASPPKFHVEQSLLALEAGLPVLLEKPVSPDVHSCQLLEKRLQKGGKLLLGYTYRWWPPVTRLKTILGRDTIGAVRHARFIMSAHLADWHPWEAYKDFFMASRELGGGALLDESHFIDLMLWLFDLPERLFARVEKISDLEIDTDDLVEILAVYPNGLRVTIHLDLFGRPHDRRIELIGEKGSIQCLFDPNEIRVGRSADSNWETETYSVERNDMFVGVAREFVQLIQGDGNNLTCQLSDGLKVLQVVEACRESQRTSRDVFIGRAC